MRPLVPLLLTLACLPACRTVYTQAPPATLEEAVMRLGTSTVTLTLTNGTSRRIRHLRLTDSTLVFSPSRRSTVHEVPRQDVLQLESFDAEGWVGRGVLLTGAGVSGGGAAGGGIGAGMCGVSTAESFPAAMAALYCFAAGAAIGALSGGVLAPVLLNPRRKHVQYRRPDPTPLD